MATCEGQQRATRRRHAGTMWRLASKYLLLGLCLTGLSLGLCIRGDRVDAVSTPVDVGLECADAVCAGNATCLIPVSTGVPVCLRRTKPGTCPFTQLAGCTEIRMMCTTDSDCSGKQICCQDQCDRVCMDPGEDIPKLGHCPSRFTFGPCINECSRDGECPGSTKCCSTGCGLICSSPQLSKPGSCPAPRGTPETCAVECTIDDECKGDQKCCSNGCGRTCQAPSKQHICPKGTTFHNKCNLCTCSDEHEPVQCEDKPCPREKPGYCPRRSLHDKIKSQGCGSKCYEDEDCPGSSKCCDVAGCGQVCAPSANEKAGICPVAEGNDPCGEFCEEDSDCPENAKCCRTGCGRICKPPDDPGFCPAQLSTPNCFFRNDQCISDKDCQSDQKCCDSPCGRACAPSVPDKPGLCPNADQLTLTKGVFCSNDHQCPQELKCCGNNRGDLGCTQPTEYKTTCRNVKCTKNGFYCIDTEDGPECIDRPKSTCAETVCDENASCLQRHDKAVCVAHTKVGHCPLIASPLRPCKEPRVLCETDEDCSGENICCTAGCVRKCVKPLKTDCASIGHSLCRTAGYICQDTPQGAVCVEDIYTCEHKRCPDGYMCHESFTGARCVKERESCATKICAPGEDCYEEEDGAICIQNYVAEGSVNTEVKAGTCPPVRPGTYRGDCQDQCKYDSECPKDKRCCNNGCANVCVKPIFRKTCADIQCLEGHACVDDKEEKLDAFCVNTSTKAGRCPAKELFDPKTRSCEDECIYDFQCPADERCCNNGCANVCVPPDLRKRCEDHNCEEGYACVDDGVRDARCVSTEPREGRCPKVDPSQYRRCGNKKDECTYDSECPEGKRCCNDGCANVCVVPDLRKRCTDVQCAPGTACVESLTEDAQCFDTTEKPGLCPKVSNDSFPRGGCKDTCKYDSQCAENSKCCFNGCAYVCLRPRKPDCEIIKCKVGYKCDEDRLGNPICSPIPCKQDGEIIDIECNSCTCIQGFLLCSQEECPPVKPGFCPKLTKGYKGKCVEDCSGDYDCRKDDKCCYTGCGHTCQTPVPEIVHPCRTVRFRCGNETRCAATRGLCQPGKTCPLSPLCVDRDVPWCDSCPDGKVCILQKKKCPAGGKCHRQPICVQLYSDDTIFEEDEELELHVITKQNTPRT